MAGAGCNPAIPVWLNEEDLNCIICHGLLDWPATLPCGHNFCRGCLRHLRAAGHGWACPTCREDWPRPPSLRKNTQLQALVDKYACAARELDAGPEPAPALLRSEPFPAAVPKSTMEAIQGLTGLVEQLVDTVKRLQRQRCSLEPGLDNELGILGKAAASVDNTSLVSPKLTTSNTSEEKMINILHNLEEIQEKLQGYNTWKVASEEQTLGELILFDQRCPAPNRASQFAPWAINPTFDLKSLSCSLEVSKDCQRVTVSPRPQPYPWSCERFSVSQVLCSQAFSSGRQYWEVDTRCCNCWAVGVASWNMNRDKMLGRTTDSWCIEWRGTGQFSAWAMGKKTDLDSSKPGIVGVLLDLEFGKLVFYSVANQERLLYECEISASSPVHPAFWLYGLNPGNSLVIGRIKA
uniref:E3 ubiquitin-protein ligase RNF135 n=1 Tax=Jaculus jaculus TaxID=51337 RepID=A0A8C5LM13_JACJA